MTSIADTPTERQFLRCDVCGHVGPDVALYRERVNDLTHINVPYCFGPGMFERHVPARLHRLREEERP